MTRLLIRTSLFAVLGIFMLQNCTDLGIEAPQSSVSDTSQVSFRASVYPLFSQYGCNGCHSTGTYNWYGTDSTTYTNLVNVPAQAGCIGKVRVLPGNAAESVLYLRLSGFTCGDRMPKGGNPIASQDLQRIANWINQGASNN